MCPFPFPEALGDLGPLMPRALGAVPFGVDDPLGLVIPFVVLFFNHLVPTSAELYF